MTTTMLAAHVRDAVAANVPTVTDATVPTDARNHESGYSGFLMKLADGKSYWVVVCPLPEEPARAG